MRICFPHQRQKYRWFIFPCYWANCQNQKLIEKTITDTDIFVAFNYKLLVKNLVSILPTWTWCQTIINQWFWIQTLHRIICVWYKIVPSNWQSYNISSYGINNWKCREKLQSKKMCITHHHTLEHRWNQNVDI